MGRVVSRRCPAHSQDRALVSQPPVVGWGRPSRLVLCVFVFQGLQVSSCRADVAVPQRVLQANQVHSVLQVKDRRRVPEHVGRGVDPHSLT